MAAQVDQIIDDPAEERLAACMPSIISLTIPFEKTCYQKEDFPRYFLSRYRSEKHKTPPVNIRRTWYIASCWNVLEVLELPILTRHDAFVYCFKTHAIWKLANQSWKKKGKKMSLFEQAALLEDMFIW